MTTDDQKLVELKRQGVRVHVQLKEAKARGDFASAAQLDKELRRLKKLIVLAEGSQSTP